MATATRRRRMTVTLPDYAMADMKKEAARTGWSMSALASEYILDAMYHTPNAETLAAIEEARNGVDMPVVDTSSYDAFIKSIMQ